MYEGSRSYWTSVTHFHQGLVRCSASMLIHGWFYIISVQHPITQCRPFCSGLNNSRVSLGISYASSRSKVASYLARVICTPHVDECFLSKYRLGLRSAVIGCCDRRFSEQLIGHVTWPLAQCTSHVLVIWSGGVGRLRHRARGVETLRN